VKTKIVVKVLVGVIVIGGGIGYFMYHAMQSSWSYYYSVDDFAQQKSSAQSHSLRIAGRVKQDSIERDLKQMTLNFTLSGSETSVPVSYKGVVPDNFAEGREVVVQGRLDTNGVFQADKLMTRCESKYKAKVK
jgi:cytochrome c-type biogenesis protein CcmE